MNINQLKKKGAAAVFWNLSGTLLRQGIAFLLSIFLARLLSPSDFGLVGMATVFISLTQGFADFGMTAGLIQKKDPTEVQYSTVFYINLIVSVVLMLLMIAFSGFIAHYYGNPEIGEIARFVSYSFVISALNGVQNARLTKALANKTKTIAAVASAVMSGVVGVLLAYNGFGVWSLVYSTLVGSILNTAIIWFRSDWRPKAVFNFKEVKPLLNFGSKMFASGMLDTAYNRLDVLIIGKLFSANTLGYYFRAVSFNQFITRYTAGSLQGVFFPVVSHLQSDRFAQLRIISKSLHIIAFLTFLLMGLMYINAKELIVLIFSDKWLMSVEYFKIMAFYGYAYPVSVILVNVLSGNGHSGKFFQLEIWKKVTGLLAMLAGFYFGMHGFLWGMVVASAIAVLLNMWFVQRVINWPVSAQFIIVYQYAAICFLGVLPVVWLKTYLPPNLWILLVGGSLIFAALYYLLNQLIKSKGQQYLLEYVLQLGFLKTKK
ncbi:MAG: lipopolysaccharide biosynthesis protein [Chitinophagaceae bacterium]|nr:lipopolysaccharide biosynthesis protein [Chitinophagaceae bacterium]